MPCGLLLVPIEFAYLHARGHPVSLQQPALIALHRLWQLDLLFATLVAEFGTAGGAAHVVAAMDTLDAKAAAWAPLPVVVLDEREHCCVLC